MSERSRPSIVDVAKRVATTGLFVASTHYAPDALATNASRSINYSSVTAQETEVTIYANAHERFAQAKQDQHVAVVSAYGTPVEGYGAGAGWGSLYNGPEGSYDINVNFRLITSELESMLPPSTKVYKSADLVFMYGTDYVKYLDPFPFARRLYEQGHTASLNLRPPAFFSVEDLNNLVTQIYSGTLRDNNGNLLVPFDFIQQTGMPLSLDLEAMLGGHPGGISAADLSLVFQNYRVMMERLGYPNPTILMYERGIGEGSQDMVDDTSKLNTEGVNLIIVYYGFVRTGNLEAKIQATKDMIEAYGMQRGGCMVFDGAALTEFTDNLTTDQIEEYVRNPICGVIMKQ